MEKKPLVRNLPEEARRFFAGHPPPRYFDTPQTLPGDSFKNPAWKARRTKQTASSAASYVGLVSFASSMNGADGKPIYEQKLDKNGQVELVLKKFSKSPQVMQAIHTGQLKDIFSGNEATQYGDTYEYYARRVGQVVFDLAIKEYGTFQSRLFPFQGSSPDGGTNAIRIKGTMQDGTPFDWILGSLNFEIKTTMAADMKTFVDVHYVIQIMFQMFTRQQAATIVMVWSRNRWRSYLYPLCQPLVVWMMRRLILVHEYFERGVRITEDNPYLCNSPVGPYGVPRTTPYPPPGKAGQATNAWYWKGATPYDQWAPHLTVWDWDRVLRELGLTHEEFCAIPGYAQFAPKIFTVPESSEQPVPEEMTRSGDVVQPQPKPGQRWCMDAGQHALPPRPPCWVIHEKDRVPTEAELEKDVLHPVSWVQHHDYDDPSFWNRDNFEHVTDFAKRARAAEARGSPLWNQKPWRNIPYMLIDEIIQMPELDMPEPVDSSLTFESETEEREYLERLAKEQAAVAHLVRAKVAKDEKIRAENDTEDMPGPRVIDASNSFLKDMLAHKRKKPVASAARKKLIADSLAAAAAAAGEEATEPLLPLAPADLFD